jgi:hypothetical protein
LQEVGYLDALPYTRARGSGAEEIAAAAGEKLIFPPRPKRVFRRVIPAAADEGWLPTPIPDQVVAGSRRIPCPRNRVR